MALQRMQWLMLCRPCTQQSKEEDVAMQFKQILLDAWVSFLHGPFLLKLVGSRRVVLKSLASMELFAPMCGLGHW